MPFHLDEPIGISPRVNIVFHKLFGDPANEALLVDFLNAVLSPQLRLVRAIVKNPFAIDQYLGQRGLIIDVHATDERGRLFQIEMQRRNERALRQRMLWGWARSYGAELGRGETHKALRSVIAVWICEFDDFPETQGAHLSFRWREDSEGTLLHPDGHINVLILPRCPSTSLAPPLKRDLLPWMRFFNEAEYWNAVPREIDTPTLEAAMEVLHAFRKDTALSHLYWTQLETERIERDIQMALREQQEAIERFQAEREEWIRGKEALRKEEEARRSAEEARRSAEEALRKEEEARRVSQAQIEALQALLRAAGIKAPTDG